QQQQQLGNTVPFTEILSNHNKQHDRYPSSLASSSSLSSGVQFDEPPPALRFTSRSASDANVESSAESSESLPAITAAAAAAANHNNQNRTSAQRSEAPPQRQAGSSVDDLL